jgi:hypothetical protein
VPQFHELLQKDQKKNAYAQKDLKELQDMLKDLDEKLDKDLKALAANYKEDKKLIRGILRQRKPGKS